MCRPFSGRSISCSGRLIGEEGIGNSTNMTSIETINRAAQSYPRWSQLRAIGGTSAARMAILVPIVGYWIIFNSELVRYSALIFDNAAATIPIRLYLTYFGLSFVGFASVIFQLACPDEIKAYASPEQYNLLAGPALAGYQIVNIERALDNGDVHARNFMVGLRNTRRSTPESLEEFRRQVEFDTKNLLAYYFEYLDRKQTLLRQVCALLYGVGFLALLWPSANIFYRVLVMFLISIIY